MTDSDDNFPERLKFYMSGMSTEKTIQVIDYIEWVDWKARHEKYEELRKQVILDSKTKE